jgi:hypothetical protein
LDTGKKTPTSVSLRAYQYLGRDGGGSRSGAGSPFGSDDESEDTPQAESRLKTTFEQGHPTLKFSSSSLARALRGECGDHPPSRSFDDLTAVADPLGDQPSDAEFEETDLDMGTKEREQREMEQILEEERHERSHRGSVY